MKSWNTFIYLHENIEKCEFQMSDLLKSSKDDCLTHVQLNYEPNIGMKYCFKGFLYEVISKNVREERF